jgi:hypothetical protein
MQFLEALIAFLRMLFLLLLVVLFAGRRRRWASR